MEHLKNTNLQQSSHKNLSTLFFVQMLILLKILFLITAQKTLKILPKINPEIVKQIKKSFVREENSS
jgi:hypothetical protein